MATGPLPPCSGLHPEGRGPLTQSALVESRRSPSCQSERVRGGAPKAMCAARGRHSPRRMTTAPSDALLAVVDATLLAAADRVAGAIAHALDGGKPAKVVNMSERRKAAPSAS